MNFQKFKEQLSEGVFDENLDIIAVVSFNNNEAGRQAFDRFCTL